MDAYKPAHRCDPCYVSGVKIDAVVYCEDCREYMCPTCCIRHQQQTTEPEVETNSKKFELSSEGVCIDQSLDSLEHNPASYIVDFGKQTTPLTRSQDAKDGDCYKKATTTIRTTNSEYQTEDAERARSSCLALLHQFLDIRSSRKCQMLDLTKQWEDLIKEIHDKRIQLSVLLDRLEAELKLELDIVHENEALSLGGDVRTCESSILILEYVLDRLDTAMTSESPERGQSAIHFATLMTKKYSDTLAGIDPVSKQVQLQFKASDEISSMIQCLKHFGDVTLHRSDKVSAQSQRPLVEEKVVLDGHSTDSVLHSHRQMSSKRLNTEKEDSHHLQFTQDYFRNRHQYLRSQRVQHESGVLHLDKELLLEKDDTSREQRGLKENTVETGRHRRYRSAENRQARSPPIIIPTDKTSSDESASEVNKLEAQRQPRRLTIPAKRRNGDNRRPLSHVSTPSSLKNSDGNTPFCSSLSSQRSPSPELSKNSVGNRCDSKTRPRSPSPRPSKNENRTAINTVSRPRSPSPIFSKNENRTASNTLTRPRSPSPRPLKNSDRYRADSSATQRSRSQSPKLSTNSERNRHVRNTASTSRSPSPRPSKNSEGNRHVRNTGPTSRSPSPRASKNSSSKTASTSRSQSPRHSKNPDESRPATCSVTASTPRSVSPTLRSPRMMSPRAASPKSILIDLKAPLKQKVRFADGVEDVGEEPGISEPVTAVQFEPRSDSAKGSELVNSYRERFEDMLKDISSSMNRQSSKDRDATSETSSTLRPNSPTNLRQTETKDSYHSNRAGSPVCISALKPDLGGKRHPFELRPNTLQRSNFERGSSKPAQDYVSIATEMKEVLPTSPSARMEKFSLVGPQTVGASRNVEKREQRETSGPLTYPSYETLYREQQTPKDMEVKEDSTFSLADRHYNDSADSSSFVKQFQSAIREIFDIEDLAENEDSKRPGERPRELSGERPGERTEKLSREPSLERSGALSGELPRERPRSPPLERSRDPSLDRPGALSGERSREQSLERSRERSRDHSLERSRALSGERSRESSLERSGAPSFERSREPSLVRSRALSGEWSREPSLERLRAPSLERSREPSLERSGAPSLERSREPSMERSRALSGERSREPSMERPREASVERLGERSREPSSDRSGAPSLERSRALSGERSREPSLERSGALLGERSREPSVERSREPSVERSKEPSLERSRALSGERSREPSLERSRALSGERSREPSVERSAEQSREWSDDRSGKQSGERFTVSQEVEQPDTSSRTTDSDRIEFVGDFFINDSSRDYPSFISGLARCRKGYLLADWNCCELKLLDDEFRYQSNLALSSSPWKVAMVTDGQAAVTLPSEWRIQLINIRHDGTLETGSCFETFGSCRDIVCSQGELVISTSDPYTVQILGLNGDVTRIMQHDSLGNQLFESSLRLAVSCDGNVIYVSEFCDGLTAITRDGKLVFTYTREDVRSSTGVTVDERGYVYVASAANNSVVQLSSDGSKMADITSETMLQPEGVSYCRASNRLIVTLSFADYIQVYRLK